jgi:hypothetical protein
MKSTICVTAILAPVLAASVVLLMAGGGQSPQFSDLTVHEWGTFTSVAGEDGAAVSWDALGCKNDPPRFVNDYGYRGFKWRLQGTVRMETPVLYFYSSREMEAQVKVAFPQGLITEWYPNADYQVFQENIADGSVRQLAANLNGIDTSMRSLTGGIEWKNIKVQPGATPALPAESTPSRYYAARGTDAAPITVDGQHEKFLFYRGVGRFPVPLLARVAASGKIVMKPRNQEAVPSVFLFENRQGRIGYRTAGLFDETLTLDPPVLSGSFPQLRQDLETALIAQGLFPKEAQAMVETWQDSWFEEGSRLIYVVPLSEVDAILPLQITPTPAQTVRVFVGRIELVTAETKQFLESAIANADWPAVDRYSRFLAPILSRMYPGNPEKVTEIEQRFQNSGYSGAANASGCAVQPAQSVVQWSVSTR